MLEDHLFLSNQLRDRNIALQREIQQLVEQMERNNSTETEIQVSKTFLKEKAKEMHVIQSSVEKEYRALKRKAEHDERNLKLIKKNYDVEVKYRMKSVMIMQDKNEETANKIMKMKKDLQKMEELREIEMIRLKEMQQQRIRDMIKNIEEDMRQDEIEKGPVRDAYDSDVFGESGSYQDPDGIEDLQESEKLDKSDEIQEDKISKKSSEDGEKEEKEASEGKEGEGDPKKGEEQTLDAGDSSSVIEDDSDSDSEDSSEKRKKEVKEEKPKPNNRHAFPHRHDSNKFESKLGGNPSLNKGGYQVKIYNSNGQEKVVGGFGNTKLRDHTGKVGRKDYGA